MLAAIGALPFRNGLSVRGSLDERSPVEQDSGPSRAADHECEKEVRGPEPEERCHNTERASDQEADVTRAPDAEGTDEAERKAEAAHDKRRRDRKGEKRVPSLSRIDCVAAMTHARQPGPSNTAVTCKRRDEMRAALLCCNAFSCDAVTCQPPAHLWQLAKVRKGAPCEPAKKGQVEANTAGE